MEKITDLFKDLRERLSNPFFSSFLIVWLIINWKISIGLLYFDPKQLLDNGYRSHIDFVSDNLHAANTIWKPLIAALSYTFVFPIIRNVIYAFNSWAKAWGNKWSLSLSKTSMVSIEKYIKLRESYLGRTKLLEEVLENERVYIRDYENEKDKVYQLSNELNRVKSELQSWKGVNDSTMMNGEWEIHYPNSLNSAVFRVRISNNSINYIDDVPEYTSRSISIRSFYKNPDLTHLTLTTVENGATSKSKFHFFQLDILDDMRLLRGREDDTLKVEFRKKM